MGNRYAFLEKQRRDRYFVPFAKTGPKFEQIESLRPQIEYDMSQLRISYDKWVIEQWEKQRTPKNTAIIDAAIARYPKGYCREISQGVLNGMLRPENHLGYPELKASGIPIKKVFGIHSKRYFQNALQIGHLYVDPANNTVDKTKSPIEITHIDESPLEQISSYDQVIPVVESYWHLGVYPNIYFPLISFVCPVIVCAEGEARFLTTPIGHVSTFETQKDYAMARQFIFDSAYSAKRLPQQTLDGMCAGLTQAAEKLLKKTEDAEYFELLRESVKPKEPEQSKTKFEQILAERAEGTTSWDALLFHIGTQFGRELCEMND